MPERYQREIEEILGKVNEEASEGEPGRPQRGQRSSRRSGATAPPRRPRRPALSFSPGGLFRVGLALLASAFVLNLLDASILGVGVAAPLAYAGVALWVTAYVLYFTRPRRTIERRWRGQVIDEPLKEGPVSRMWRWITRG